MKFYGILITFLFAKTLGQTRYPCHSNDFNLTLHNHALSCNKYVLCVAGTAVIRDCAPGLHFDLERQNCLPENVTNCDIENRECPPFDDPSNLIFIPDEQCDRYFMCNQGNKIELQCGQGLHWNPENNWCDFPENVGCPNHVECPEQGIAYLPHPTNCQQFFLCINGQPTIHRCSEGLIFDIEREQCFFEDQSTCILDQNRGPCYGISAGLVIDPDNCYNYHLCVDGTVEQTFVCDLGHIFVHDSCVPGNQETCEVEIETTTESITTETEPETETETQTEPDTETETETEMETETTSDGQETEWMYS